MEEKRASKQCGGVLPFFIGVLASLVIGWWVFPQVIYSQKTQPIDFSHKVHVEGEGMDCESCHTFMEDGSFAGLPSNEKCAECHEDLLGETKAEETYVNEYLKKDIEVPWLVYQYQPDNVYFSHMAHKGFECTDCHPDVGNGDTLPTYYENRISGYSKQTMKMWQCERCHAEVGTSNACYVCHK
jgi:hypothetical protein